MILLVVFLLALAQVSQGCFYSGYQPYWDGNCVKTTTAVNYDQESGWAASKTLCDQDKTSYPALLTPEHSAKFQEISNSVTGYQYSYFLDLHCVNGRWAWPNGQLANWTNFNVNDTIPATCTKDIHLTRNWVDGTWKKFRQSTTIRGICHDSTPVDPLCGTFTPITGINRTTGYCARILTKAKTWDDAQRLCEANGAYLAVSNTAEINAFIRRLGLANQFREGMHIGLRVSKTDSYYYWDDGTKNKFNNWQGGYPNSKYGDCALMDTTTIGGLFANTDCNVTKLPFVCTKPAKDNVIPKPACSDVVLKSGDHFYSPGFPVNASEPCDYNLTAPSGKTVQLEIVTLDANTCCDVLQLVDGRFAGKIIANLTGSNPSTRFYTSASGSMRVHWMPKGGHGVAGFHGIFRVI